MRRVAVVVVDALCIADMCLMGAVILAAWFS